MKEPRRGSGREFFGYANSVSGRYKLLLTFATEQTIRENYLKGFEIGLKKYEGNIQAMMSSFNFIGTVASSANPELLNDVLRTEWGFQGMVITDYDGSYGYMSNMNKIFLGVDILFAVLYLLCQFLLFKGWKKKKEALKLAVANPAAEEPKE